MKPDPPIRRRRWLRRGLWVLSVPVGVVLGLNLWVLSSGWSRMYGEGAVPPETAVGLVLGTSKRRENGQPNLHFRGRMEAAARLFKAGRIRHLLVSGACSGQYYNEPKDMKAALMAQGVPESAITCDFGGERTLDSVVRAREAFGLRECVIVSDGWHVPRALFIARKIGLEATGAASGRIPLRDSFVPRSREWLARVLVVFDLYVLGTRPEHPADGSEEPLGRRFAGVSAPGTPGSRPRP
jgi:SanA protein